MSNARKYTIPSLGTLPFVTEPQSIVVPGGVVADDLGPERDLNVEDMKALAAWYAASYCPDPPVPFVHLPVRVTELELAAVMEKKREEQCAAMGIPRSLLEGDAADNRAFAYAARHLSFAIGHSGIGKETVGTGRAGGERIPDGPTKDPEFYLAGEYASDAGRLFVECYLGGSKYQVRYAGSSMVKVWTQGELDAIHPRRK